MSRMVVLGESWDGLRLSPAGRICFCQYKNSSEQASKFTENPAITSCFPRTYQTLKRHLLKRKRVHYLPSRNVWYFIDKAKQKFCPLCSDLLLLCGQISFQTWLVAPHILLQSGLFHRKLKKLGFSELQRSTTEEAM